jgi:hypothetical protein
MIFSDCKALQLSDIDFLHKVTIEEGIPHIHVMHPSPLMRSHDQDQLD